MLDQKGYLKDSIVIITGDHGEGLGERGNYSYGHARYLYQESIHVPLLIYADYQNLSFARQIDIAPTIVDRLGLLIPSSWHGSSLLNTAPPSLSFHQTKKESPCYAVIFNHSHKRFKYIKCIQNPVEDVFEFTDHEKRKIKPTEELYELTSDLYGLHNLLPNADLNLLDTLRLRLQDYINATE